MYKLVIVLILLNFSFTFGQTLKESFESKILNCDKIEIISHEDLKLIKEKPGKSKIYIRNIIENGKPNKSIIKENVKLDELNKNEIYKILTNQNKENLAVESAYCFEPHHTILIYKNGKCSFIDICFGCKQYSTSDDILKSDKLLSTEDQWKSLELFFRNQKIKYKISK